MVGLAEAVEQLTLQRDGFAGAAATWQARHDEIAQGQMRLRDLLGMRDHEIVALTRANRELLERVRKLEASQKKSFRRA